MTKHTPTPWQTTADGNSFMGPEKQWIAGPVNAALIVRAVNSHDALVEALKAVQMCPQAATWLAKLPMPNAHGNGNVWDAIEAALIKAEG